MDDQSSAASSRGRGRRGRKRRQPQQRFFRKPVVVPFGLYTVRIVVGKDYQTRYEVYSRENPREPDKKLHFYTQALYAPAENGNLTSVVAPLVKHAEWVAQLYEAEVTAAVAAATPALIMQQNKDASQQLPGLQEETANARMYLVSKERAKAQQEEAMANALNSRDFHNFMRPADSFLNDPVIPDPYTGRPARRRY